MRRVVGAGATLLVLLSVLVGAAAVVAPPPAGAATTTTAHGLGSAADLVVDPATGRVYVSGGNGVVVFAPDGTLLTTIGGIAGAGPMVLRGGSLWVAATTAPAMARIDLATSSLAEVVPVTGTMGDSVAVAGDGVFFVLRDLDGDEVARLDVVTHAITTFPSYDGVRVASIPGATDRLVVYDRLTPTRAAIVGAVAPHAVIASMADGGNAIELAVSPDGDAFWIAAAGGGLVERRFSTGTATGAIYPTDGHARHVVHSPARGGMLASWSDASDQLFVSILGTTTGLSALATSADVAGVGVATDGAAVYYADHTSLVRMTLDSSITSITPASFVAGVPATIVAKGVGLGATSTATVGGVPATIQAWAPTQVDVALPLGLGAGTHQLVLTGSLGAATASVTVVANTGATLTGLVRVGGTAVSGVAVRVSGGGLASPVDVVTNASGRYTASGLPLGTGYRLAVTKPATATSGHVVDGLALVPNQITTIDVDLRSPSAAPAFITPTSLPGTGGLGASEVEATTSRTFVPRGSDLLVLGPDGVLAGRLLGVGSVRRITSGNGVVYVSSATTEGIRIRRVDPASLVVTGSWLLDAPSNGEMALVGTRLFVLAGTSPSYESGTYDLRTFDPATGTTSVVPAPRSYAGLQVVQRDANRLIGLNIVGTSVLDVSGPTAVATGTVFLPLVTWVVADGPSNRLWTSAGAELDLSTLLSTGRTFAATGVPSVAAGAGVILFGSSVFRLDDPATVRHVLTVGTGWTFAPSGDRAFGRSTTNQFLVADLTPHVTEPLPTYVWTEGSTIPLTGYGLLPTTAVAIDGVGVPFTVVSPDRVDVTAGSLTPGSHSLTVTTPWGTTTPIPFTAYVLPAPPTVTSMSPTQGPPAGGTSVIVRGTGFEFVTAVTFDGIPATSFTVLASTHIRAFTPAHAVGPVAVRVTNGGGTSPATPASTFTYQIPAPAITLLTPKIGSTAGGYPVTIKGARFTGTSAVRFGGVPATSFSVIDDSTISAVAPPHAAGAVSVLVTTSSGTNVDVPEDRFTYQVPPTGSLTGVVRGTAGPIGGMLVLVSPTAAPSITASATTAPDGTFTVAALPVGTYKVLTIDPAAIWGVPSAYVAEWYQGTGPGTTDFAAATTVSVSANTATPLETIALLASTPGSIAGVVTDGTAPLANMVVLVSPASSLSTSAYALTGADGSYVIGGLAPGSYKVLTFDAAQLFGLPAAYVGELYDDVAASPTAFADSTTVTVSVGATTTLVDIVLAHT